MRPVPADLELACEVKARLEAGEQPVRVSLEELMAEVEGEICNAAHDAEAARRGLSESELLERDAGRDLGAELLTAILDVKAGRYGDVHSLPCGEECNQSEPPAPPSDQ